MIDPDGDQTSTVARRPRVMWWTLLLAAIAIAIAITAVTLTRSGPADEPPPLNSHVQDDSVRVTELQAASPAGASELLREFRWHSPIDADRYRVIVRRGTTIVWQVETAELRTAPPPAGTIERDVHYEWLVEALDREGNVRLTSPSQSFVVY